MPAAHAEFEAHELDDANTHSHRHVESHVRLTTEGFEALKILRHVYVLRGAGSRLGQCSIGGHHPNNDPRHDQACRLHALVLLTGTLIVLPASPCMPFILQFQTERPTGCSSSYASCTSSGSGTMVQMVQVAQVHSSQRRGVQAHVLPA